jgi:hypothetical protein
VRCGTRMWWYRARRQRVLVLILSNSVRVCVWKRLAVYATKLRRWICAGRLNWALLYESFRCEVGSIELQVWPAVSLAITSSSSDLRYRLVFYW